MTTYIFLDDLRFYAYHGVAAQEKLIGNEYILSLRLRVDISRAMQTDDVADTVNYAAVHEVLKQEMSVPSRLLEHVAGRMLKRLFREFPAVEAIGLKLSKRNPPMGADIAAAGVEIMAERSSTDA